jgi:AcrR family transcriptional regulator
VTRATRAFKQRRAAASHQSLLAAAARVFSRRGFDDAQSPEIAAEAGLSTGAFYRYFADKRQAFIEVAAAHLERVHNDILARLQPERFRGGDARAAIDHVIDVLFDHLQRDRALQRAMLTMSMRDDEVQRLRVTYEGRGLDALTALIAEVIPASRVPHPRAAATVIQLAALEIGLERAGLRPAVEPRVPDAEVKQALREMIHRYLFDGAPAPRGLRRPRPNR